MDIPSVFRIHQADPLGLVDTPIIITAAYSTAGMPRSEWFLVVPEGKGMVFAQRNRLDQATLPAGPLLLDAELLLSEALDQARLRLRRYILENKGHFAPLLLSKPVELQPAGAQQLAQLWMRGAYCGCLSEIRGKTGCSPLIDLMVWIHGLPMLAASEL